MSTIRVTFADGTHEDRPANSPLRHGLNDYYGDLFLSGLLPTSWVDVVQYAAAHSLKRCGRSGNTVLVWCITGGHGEGELLTGEWRPCRGEGVVEHIARLEAERNAETKRADDYKKRVCSLRMALKRIEVMDFMSEAIRVAAHALKEDDAARGFATPD